MLVHFFFDFFSLFLTFSFDLFFSAGGFENSFLFTLCLVFLPSIDVSILLPVRSFLVSVVSTCQVGLA